MEHDTKTEKKSKTTGTLPKTFYTPIDNGSGKVNATRKMGQGEFVLARNIKIVKELTRLLDISPRIVYNRYRLHDGGTINLKP